MRPSEPSIPVDRITYRTGQLLTARDLRDEERRHLHLRWLHHLYLHDGWGIVQGLEISLDKNTLAVSPGYAVDAWGRDLLLSEPRTVVLPPGNYPEIFILTMSYSEAGLVSNQRAFRSNCPGPAPKTHPYRPEFAWRRPDKVNPGGEVPLVQVGIPQGGGIALTDLDFRLQRHVRPLVRPFIAWGTTEPGRTGWDEWRKDKDTNTVKTIGLEVIVDTSEAGFLQPPFYFAALHSGTAPPGLPAMLFSLSSPGYGFIAEASKDYFIYRIASENLPHIPDQAAATNQLVVSWLGVEPAIPCQAPIFKISKFHVWEVVTSGLTPISIAPPVRKRCKDG